MLQFYKMPLFLSKCYKALTQSTRVTNTHTQESVYVHANNKDLTLLRLHRRRQPPGLERLLVPGLHSSPDLFLSPCPTGAKELDAQKHTNRVRELETKRSKPGGDRQHSTYELLISV